MIFRRYCLCQVNKPDALDENQTSSPASRHLLLFLSQPKKKKNISHDAFGTRLGRLHMQKQDLDKLQTRKMKGLRKRRGERTAETPATKAPRTDGELQTAETVLRDPPPAADA